LNADAPDYTNTSSEPAPGGSNDVGESFHFLRFHVEHGNLWSFIVVILNNSFLLPMPGKLLFNFHTAAYFAAFYKSICFADFSYNNVMFSNFTKLN
jgi:hypothetical protein